MPSHIAHSLSGKKKKCNPHLWGCEDGLRVSHCGFSFSQVFTRKWESLFDVGGKKPSNVRLAKSEGDMWNLMRSELNQCNSMANITSIRSQTYIYTCIRMWSGLESELSIIEILKLMVLRDVCTFCRWCSRKRRILLMSMRLRLGVGFDAKRMIRRKY